MEFLTTTSLSCKDLFLVLSLPKFIRWWWWWRCLGCTMTLPTTRKTQLQVTKLFQYWKRTSYECDHCWLTQKDDITRTRSRNISIYWLLPYSCQARSSTIRTGRTSTTESPRTTSVAVWGPTYSSRLVIAMMVIKMIRKVINMIMVVFMRIALLWTLLRKTWCFNKWANIQKQKKSRKKQKQIQRWQKENQSCDQCMSFYTKPGTERRKDWRSIWNWENAELRHFHHKKQEQEIMNCFSHDLWISGPKDNIFVYFADHGAKVDEIKI